MREQLISFETAKLAKGKGFDAETDANYFIGNTYGPGSKEHPELSEYNIEGEYDSTYPKKINHNKYPAYISVPTQSLLQKWLREKHNIHIYITYGYGWEYNVFKRFVLPPHPEHDGTYNDYEEALEDGLCCALKLIK